MHKVVLCTHSAFFKAALLGNFKESKTSEVVLDDEDPKSVDVSLYKQLEPFADVAGLAIGDPAGQRFSSTEQQYTTITTIGHEC